MFRARQLVPAWALSLLVVLAGGRIGRAQAVPFLRGDVNASGVVDISDSVSNLLFLFTGGNTPPCMDAADTDNSGALDLNDAVLNLKFQFQGGTDMPPPHPDCGEDPTLDQLGCENPGACASD